MFFQIRCSFNMDLIPTEYIWKILEGSTSIIKNPN